MLEKNDREANKPWTIAILCDQAHPPSCWQNLVSYLQGDGFHASVRQSLASDSAPAHGLIVAGSLWSQPWDEEGLLWPRAIAIIDPRVSTIPRLWYQPHRRPPVWLAMADSRQSMLFQLTPRSTIHQFVGLKRPILTAPGWERVAYALRIWLAGILTQAQTPIA